MTNERKVKVWLAIAKICDSILIALIVLTMWPIWLLSKAEQYAHQKALDAKYGKLENY